MEKNTNLFYHATKELSTDAFLTWILYFLDSSENYSSFKQSFFDDIILRPVDKGRKVSNIEVRRQDHDIDVLLSFRFEDTQEKHKVIFEDKIYTTHHDRQMEKYKRIYPDCYRYIYYKLAYINSQEKYEVMSFGYDVFNASQMANALKNLVGLHTLIKMYYDFLYSEYVERINSYKDKLFDKHDYDILWDEGAQKYLCDCITEEMKIQNFPYIEIRNGSSFGRPWTQIDIARAEGKYFEVLFWRVDIRSDKFYIRLNQYSEPSDLEVQGKMNRLATLRQSIQSTLESMPEVVAGKTINKGVKESEIAIFFLDDNDLNMLIDKIPTISKNITEVFKELNFSQTGN